MILRLKMKKSLIISSMVTLILFAIDTISILALGILPFAINFGGGECNEYIGIGWYLLRLYPLTVAGETPKNTTEIGFYPPTLIAVFVAIWIVTFVIVKIAGMRKIKK